MTATHCNTRQHTATHGNTRQHTATHCNTLQHTATHCNTRQHTATQAYRGNDRRCISTGMYSDTWRVSSTFRQITRHTYELVMSQLWTCHVIQFVYTFRYHLYTTTAMNIDTCRVSSTFGKTKYVQVLNVYRYSVHILHVYRMFADIRRIGRGFFWHRAGLRYDANNWRVCNSRGSFR